MSIVKNTPRTATTIVVRSDANTRISHSRDPYYGLIRRVFKKTLLLLEVRNFQQ